jgi:hypothetical protein
MTDIVRKVRFPDESDEPARLTAEFPFRCYGIQSSPRCAENRTSRPRSIVE